MLPGEIMQSDMLDIVFEHRNKAYGAYLLRKSYNKRLVAALIITLLVAAVFSVLQLLHRSGEHMYARTVTIDDPHLINLPSVPPQPQPPTPAHQSPVHFREAIISTPEIVNENQPTTVPTIDELTNSMISNEISTGEIPKGNVVVVSVNSGITPSGTVSAAEPVTDDGPLITAEFMPEFPGGIEALRKFLLKNIRQPDDLRTGEKIVVLASFVVSGNGQIEGVKILNSGRTDLDKEVLRVIAKMPAWKPGMQNGHEVSVYFNLPVTFVGADGE